MSMPFKIWLRRVKNIKPCDFRGFSIERQDKLHSEYALYLFRYAEVEEEYRNDFHEQTD